MLASGMTEEEILDDFPYLEKADFPAVYGWVSERARNESLTLDGSEPLFRVSAAMV